MRHAQAPSLLQSMACIDESTEFHCNLEDTKTTVVHFHASNDSLSETPTLLQSSSMVCIEEPPAFQNHINLEDTKTTLVHNHASSQSLSESNDSPIDDEKHLHLLNHLGKQYSMYSNMTAQYESDSDVESVNSMDSDMSISTASNASNHSNANDDEMKQSAEDQMFQNMGYEKLNKITDTLQGELFKATVIRSTDRNYGAGPVGSIVDIKRVSRQLSESKIAENDGMTYCVATDIKKEALLLKYLTVDNMMIGNCLVRYIDFFQSSQHYYLVTEHIDGYDLKQFVKKCRQYITSGLLSLTEYKKSVKFIMFQLAVCLNSLHSLYRCCKLDLNLENILLQNVRFIEHENGSISIPPSISIKLIDFGVAEIFDASKSKKSKHFKCNKQDLSVDNEEYQAPNILNGQEYDARAADMWAMGIIFFQCLTGQDLMEQQQNADEQSIEEPEECEFEEEDIDDNSLRAALMKNELKRYLKETNLIKYFKQYSFKLLQSLLNVNEKKRMSAKAMLKHPYFKSYFKTYKDEISMNMDEYLEKVNNQQSSSKKDTLPYYNDGF